MQPPNPQPPGLQHRSPRQARLLLQPQKP
ncbi:hypothetical protein LINPERPRIM_LOCUS42600 [Linum perenne]